MLENTSWALQRDLRERTDDLAELPPLHPGDGLETRVRTNGYRAEDLTKIVRISTRAATCCLIAPHNPIERRRDPRARC